MAQTPTAEHHACTNCGAAFVPKRRAFCPECGQETHIEPPRLGEFLQQFGGAYLSTEGALWRTLKLLLFKPGEATAQYLAGRRKHYVLPLRLYLSISLVLLVVLRLDGFNEVLPGLNSASIVAAEKTEFNTMMMGLGVVEMGIRRGSFVCTNLPQFLCQQLRKRAVTDTRTFLQKARVANERVVANLGAVMFVLLPLFAACLKLVNRQQGLPYAAHLVFALHLHAFWFIVLAAVQVTMRHTNISLWGWSPVLWLGVAVMAAYTLKAGARVYTGSWRQRLQRSALLTLMYTALLAVTVPTAWLLALML